MFVNSNSQTRKTDSRLQTQHQDEQETLTGTLRMNPRAYLNRDGSHTYLFWMDVESQTGSQNNNQLNRKASLVAYVPAGCTDYCAALRRGDYIKVIYAVQTDYYLDKEGRSAKKTYLRAKGVYSLNRAAGPVLGRGQPTPPSAPPHRCLIPTAPPANMPSDFRMKGGRT